MTTDKKPAMLSKVHVQIYLLARANTKGQIVNMKHLHTNLHRKKRQKKGKKGTPWRKQIRLSRYRSFNLIWTATLLCAIDTSRSGWLAMLHIFIELSTPPGANFIFPISSVFSLRLGYIENNYQIQSFYYYLKVHLHKHMILLFCRYSYTLFCAINGKIPNSGT